MQVITRGRNHLDTRVSPAAVNLQRCSSQATKSLETSRRDLPHFSATYTMFSDVMALHGKIYNFKIVLMHSHAQCDSGKGDLATSTATNGRYDTSRPLGIVGLRYWRTVFSEIP
ncbi:PREDICTED: uncharacterized protein LOC108764587 [Trachymyrmex cornetzi]|uniref:uncharacterized protein LOC108764587 n=1 Tax=Trachymyrmex cornetzi TaxID=471704 RepID=UPI00084F329C|nr:PREDICTED: uncharacterized protein LOC108764587 [Trachymyrmex cornetzi]